MIDTLRLTAEGAKDLLDQGEVSGAELFAAYRAAIDESNDELNAYLTLADDPGGDGIPIAYSAQPGGMTAEQDRRQREQ